jgi:hypothetical protein
MLVARVTIGRVNCSSVKKLPFRILRRQAGACLYEQIYLNAGKSRTVV